MPGTSRRKALRIGAVAYDPKVVTIWEGFKDYFAACGVEIDFILYSHMTLRSKQTCATQSTSHGIRRSPG